MSAERASHPHSPQTDVAVRRRFRERVRRYYRRHGRDLPWRRTWDPYRILVSEVMLQQTQVDRVAPKYRAFLRQFPTARKLAAAPLSSVLAAWQGLGYNRRAKMLQQAARAVVEEHGGAFPNTEETLQELPGVGPYTAAAVAAFSYDQPVVLVETNIRTVFIYEFFPGDEAVSDVDIRALVVETLDRRNPREWYSALMDYGAYLKRTHGNPNVRSKHYTKQSKFEGSVRQLRGAILRELTRMGKGMTVQTLARRAGRSTEETERQLEKLASEGMLTRRGSAYTIAR